MKAIVINASPSPSGNKPPFKEGEIVTVSQCDTYPDNYDVLEYSFTPDGKLGSWGKFRFIPVSEIDETEFERSYKIEKSFI